MTQIPPIFIPNHALDEHMPSGRFNATAFVRMEHDEQFPQDEGLAANDPLSIDTQQPADIHSSSSNSVSKDCPDCPMNEFCQHLFCH